MKTLLNLYIDGEIKALAKSKGINLSRTFEQFLSFELEIAKTKDKLTDKQLISELKQKLAIISAELSKKNEELLKFKSKFPDDGIERLSNGKPRFRDLGIRI